MGLGWKIWTSQGRENVGWRRRALVSNTQPCSRPKEDGEQKIKKGEGSKRSTLSGSPLTLILRFEVFFGKKGNELVLLSGSRELGFRHFCDA